MEKLRLNMAPNVQDIYTEPKKGLKRGSKTTRKCKCKCNITVSFLVTAFPSVDSVCGKQRRGSFGTPLLFFCLFLFFRDRSSLCYSPGCPGICSVGQADLKLTEICLPLLSELGLKA